ncbi:uncharacterized protein [Littorina saxatilis]|uniref:Uncharacterized protein n=1 Tax=Littorina saxatilis TaxID=31220 RepID=A0AAN9ALT2_9CAEN
MRIMCVAVVLIVYISDRQELGLHAGSEVQQKENGEGRARKKVFHDKNIHHHQGTALPLLMFRTVDDGRTRLPNHHRNDINIVKMFTGKIRAENRLDNKLANTHNSWSNSTGDGKRLDNNSKSHDSTDRKAGATDLKISELNNKGRTVSIKTTEIHKNRHTRIKKWRQRPRRSRRSSPKRSRENTRRSPSGRTAEALPQETTASPSIRSQEGVTAHTDDLTGRQLVFADSESDSDSDSTSTVKPARSSDSLLAQQTTFTKVSILILMTFPPGVFLGYLTIAVIFILRYRRCLCCLEGCEGACNRMLHLERRPQHNYLPRLSQVQISARHVYIPRRKPSMAYQEDRKLLVSQFEEDRKEFQRTGIDPQVDTDDLQDFKDSPSMTRKEWLRKRLQWWLGNDRRRALTGYHTDPNGPPEEFTPQAINWKDPNKKHHHHGVKTSSSDFTSVSMTRSRTTNSTRERTEAKKEEDSDGDESSVDTASYESEASEAAERSEAGEKEDGD